MLTLLSIHIINDYTILNLESNSELEPISILTFNLLIYSANSNSYSLLPSSSSSSEKFFLNSAALKLVFALPFCCPNLLSQMSHSAVKQSLLTLWRSRQLFSNLGRKYEMTA